MNRLQMTKRALVSYVNAVKFIWSTLAYPLTIVGKKNMNLRDYKIYGNSIQDGTPSPEAPIEIQSVGELVTEGDYAGKYKIPVRARGKNLFDCLNSQKYENNYGYDNAIITDRTENSITIQKTMTGNYEFAMFPLPDDLVGKTITVCAEWTCSGDNAGMIRVNWDTKLEYSNIIAHSLKSGVAASGVVSEKPANATHLALLLYAGTTTNHVIGDEVYYKNVMVTIGDESTAISYEPYIEPQTFNIYLDEPLRKIGDYADYIDSDKDVVARKVRKKVCDGTETWGRDSACFSLVIPTYFLSVDLVHCLCNYLRGETWENIWGNYDRINGEKVVGVAKKSDRITVTPYPTLPTTEEWKAQLAAWYEEGNPFTVWYVIPTIEEPIELPELPTFKGTTIYEIDTSVKPSGMEVKYC